MADNDEIIIKRIDWEKSRDRGSDLRVQYAAGEVTGISEFAPPNESPQIDPAGNEINPSAKEVARRKRHKKLNDGPIHALVDALNAVTFAAPTFKGKTVGQPKRLFRFLIGESTAKTVVNGAIVDEPVYEVDAMWGESSGNPIRHKLTGSHLQSLIAAVVTGTKELIDGELLDAE